MIDPLTEEIILPRVATGLFPRQPNGKKIDTCTIYRYMKQGCRGEILESIRTPRLTTSRQAIARFMQRLSEATPTAEPVIRSSATRERDNRAIEKELEQLGF
jgi:hypothetical protein